MPRAKVPKSAYTRSKGTAPTIFFILLASSVQLAVTVYFLSTGLNEPCFHILIPPGVISVLTAAWANMPEETVARRGHANFHLEVPSTRSIAVVLGSFGVGLLLIASFFQIASNINLEILTTAEPMWKYILLQDGAALFSAGVSWIYARQGAK